MLKTNLAIDYSCDASELVLFMILNIFAWKDSFFRTPWMNGQESAATLE